MTRFKHPAAGWLLLFTAISTLCFGAQDTDSADSRAAYKLTPTYYQSSDGDDAMDVNLRGTVGAHTAWTGLYQDKANFRQARTGYEYRNEYEFVRPVWSAQLASGGFMGGSVTAEVGTETYAIAGWGRTNLKPYYNLNFDPNDAITLGIGTRSLPQTELSLFHIWDDRLDTRQHVTHAVWGYKPNLTERWTVDSSFKHGLDSNGDNINGYALAVNYASGKYSIRIACDQYANFSSNTQARFSLGLHF